MSTLSVVDLVVATLQKTIDSLALDDCSPAMLLKQFDFGLLTHAEVKIRKAALLTLFVILKAAVSRPADAKTVTVSDNQPLLAPLIIKDDIVYLAANSGDNGLTRFHLMMTKTSKRQPLFMDRHIFAYHMNGARDGLLLGVESGRAGKNIPLKK